MIVNSQNQPSRQLLNPNLFGQQGLLRNAMQHGAVLADMPMPNDQRRQIIAGLMQNLEKDIPARVATMKRQNVGKATLEALAQQIGQGITHKTDKSIDSASLAAASVIMPRLAKSKKPKTPAITDWSNFSDNPPSIAPSTKSIQRDRVTPDILSGLGEGTGEDIAPSDQPAGGFGGGGGFAPESNTMPEPADFAALEPGRENLPAFDLSSKQKAAFAQQQLEQQLARMAKVGGRRAAATDLPENSPEAGEVEPDAAQQPQRGVEDLLQLQQSIADEGKNFSVRGKKSSHERLQHTTYNKLKHRKHRFDKVLKKDRAYRQSLIDRGGSGGTVQQGLARKAAYYLGLSVLEKQATETSKKIQSNIEHGKFRGFIPALILALIADGLSIGAIFFDGNTLTGLIMWAVNIVLLISLGVIILGHGHYFLRWVIKRLFGKQITKFFITLFSLCVEFTPIAEVVPMWTIQIVWLEYDVKKAIAEHKKDLKELDNEVKAELLQAKRGQGNERKIAKLKAKLERLRKKAYA